MIWSDMIESDSEAMRCKKLHQPIAEIRNWLIKLCQHTFGVILKVSSSDISCILPVCLEEPL